MQSKLVPRIIRGLVAAAVVAAIGYWLFLDTYRHYARRAPDLRVACWGDYQTFGVWQDIVRAFERQNPGTVVTLEYTPDYDQYMQRLQAMNISNTLPDVMQFDDDFFLKLAVEMELEPLDSWFAEDPDLSTDAYNSHGLKVFKSDGRQLGVPLWGFTILIIANRTSFKRAGVPLPDDENWTLEDFYQTCRDVTSGPEGFQWKGRRVRQFAVMLPQWTYFAPIFWAEGARMLDESRTHWRLYGPEALRALTRYQDMAWKEHVSPTATDMMPGSDVSFYTGRSAMMFSGAWRLPFLENTNVDYVVLHAPRGKDGRRVTRETWDGLCIPRNSGKKALAWKFVKFMTGPQGASRVLKNKVNIPSWQASHAEFGKDDREHEVHKFVEAISYARPTPITRDFMKMTRATREAFQRMMRKEEPDPGNWANRSRRLTPEETIQLLLSRHGEMVGLFPPEDKSVITDVPVD